jgi:hypothetical protein
MIEFDSYRTGIQGTSLGLKMVKGAPHKPFDPESLDLELETEGFTTEGLRAERFTPPYDELRVFDMPGVHIGLQPTPSSPRSSLASASSRG